MKSVAILLCLCAVSTRTVLGRELELGGGGGASRLGELAKQVAPVLLQRKPFENFAIDGNLSPLFGLLLTGLAQSGQAQQQVGQVQRQQQTSEASSSPLQAAIQSEYSVEVVDVPSSDGQAESPSIFIGPNAQPLNLEFQSQSSPLSVRQTHFASKPSPVQFASHQEEADLLQQEIIKPVVHEVTEAIQPIRRITQEVRPVQQTIRQVINRAAGGSSGQSALGQPLQTPNSLAIQGSLQGSGDAHSSDIANTESNYHQYSPVVPLAIADPSSRFGQSGGGSIGLRTILPNARIIRYRTTKNF